MTGAELDWLGLLDAFDVGFCIVELALDGSERVVDGRIIETNRSFSTQSGVQGAEGRLLRDLAPGLEQRWFDALGGVASTGQVARFEDRAVALNRWFEVLAFRVGPPSCSRVGILFRDVTERRRTLAQMNVTLAEREQVIERLQRELWKLRRERG